MLSVIRKVLPDAYEQLLRRYQILSVIKNDGPIGRRLLSEKLELTERSIRNEVELLKKQELISTSKVGMTLSPEGLAILNQLSHLLERQSHFTELEKSLAEYLQIEKCTILPGDMDRNRKVLSAMADKAVDVINLVLGEDKQVIAVMGGSTLNEVAEHMNESISYKRDLLFVPARGGLGDDPQNEANVIAQRMAQRTGGQVHGLYAPAHVHQEIYEELLNEPEIKQTLELIENASMILYSIGNPIEMAERRGLDESTIKLLIEREAVAEVFGEFINQEGEVVYKLSNIGLRSSALRKIKHNVAIAGGSKKATAISSYLKIAPSHTWLITDEAAANKILNGGNPLK
jgi:central glycolytic genes regulator